MIPRQRGLCGVDEFVKVSCWAPGAEALVAIQPELIRLKGSVACAE